MKSALAHKLGVFALALTVILACNLAPASPALDTAATMVVQTLSVLQTAAAATSTAAAAPAPPGDTAPPPPSPAPAVPTPTAKSPTVRALALCWTGPGDAYPVVSSVQANTEVKVMGVGSIAGWLVIENPRYHDPCWIEIKNLTLDPNFNTAGLRVYNPPPTPGPTATQVPSPTPV
jgi:uncharacterized protein YgiM (DUF1202 family)